VSLKTIVGGLVLMIFVAIVLMLFYAVAVLAAEIEAKVFDWSMVWALGLVEVVLAFLIFVPRDELMRLRRRIPRRRTDD
jgi:uncharacterized membrane protein